jgi:hypothetical protein
MQRRKLIAAAGAFVPGVLVPVALVPSLSQAASPLAVPAWIREVRTATADLPVGAGTATADAPVGAAMGSAGGSDTRGLIPVVRKARASRLQMLPYLLDPDETRIGTLEEQAADARLEVQPPVELPNGFEQRIVARARLVGDSLPFGAAAIRVVYEKTTGHMAAVALELASEDSLNRALARIKDVGLAEVPGTAHIEGATRYLESPGRAFVLIRRGAASILVYARLDRLANVARG